MLGWIPIPNKNMDIFGDITTNSLGYRSKEIDKGKEIIAILRDSVI